MSKRAPILSTSLLEICKLLCRPLKCANQIFILTPELSEVYILMAATSPPRLVSNSYTHGCQLEAFSLVDRWYVPTNCG